MEVENLGVPIKSQNDKKDYRVIKLKNGLKAFLIRNPKDGEKAAAQLTVNIGTFDNPDHVEGLAHFLEHLLHMGSVKYPGESFYTDFLHANGGGGNAKTASETTEYFFTISEKAFEQCLDIFSSIFMAPILSKDSLQREREAVDSEFHLTKADDFLIIERIFQNFSSDDHSYRKFDCGNLKTLKENINDDDLHMETLKMFEKYNANGMYLTAESHRSLDDLQNLVVEKFSGIKSGENYIRVTPSYDKAFKEDFFSKIIFYKPRNDRQLQLTWVLPPYHVNYKNNLTGYFGELFKERSLLKYFRDRKLINELYHFDSLVHNSFYMFKIVLFAVNEFTNEDIEEILKALYSYLMMLSETPIEEHRLKFEERMKRKNIEFRFHEEQNALENVKNLCENLRNCDVEDILARDSVIEFDENIFNEFMGILTSGKFNLTICDPKHDDFNRREDKYDVAYHLADYPESWKKLWENRSSRPEFYLEKLNPFIAENFEILQNKSESQEYPEKIHECRTYELWHKLDAAFNSPKVYIKIRFIAPISFRNTESFVYQEVYDHMLSYYLEDLTGIAKQGHLSFVSSVSSRIYDFTFEGFNDKLGDFFEIILQKIKAFNDNIEDNFYTSTINQMKLKYSKKMSNIRQLNRDTLDEVLSESHQHDFEIYKQIAVTTFEQLKMFVPKFFSRMKVQMLVQGNFRRFEALKLMNILKNNFSFEPIEEELEIKQKCHQIPFGESFLRIKSMQKRDDNSMIKSYYQFGKATVRTKSYMSFLKLILYPKTFDYLRTKEQLGYVVNVSSLFTNGILGLIAYVGSQESKHQYTEVQRKIKHFIDVVAKQAISELTDDEFETLKETLVQKELEKDDSLSKEFSRNWNEIKTMEYNFNIKDITAKVIETITKSEIQDFFKTFTQTEGSRILNIQVIGDSETVFDEPKLEFIKEKSGNDEVLVTNIEEFKNSMSFYPVIKFEI